MPMPSLKRILSAVEKGKDPGLEPESRFQEIVDAQEAPTILEQERKLVAKLRRMKREAKLAKEAHTGNWLKWPEYYRGKQWPSNLPSFRVPGVINFVQQLVERKAALLTDAQPIIKVSHNLPPSAPDDTLKAAQDTADVLERYINSLWAEHGILNRIARGVVYAEVFGGTAFNTTIDVDRGRLGPDPTIFVVDPRNVYFDPQVFVGDDLYRAYYQIISDLRPTDYLRDRYPEAADKLRPSERFSASDGDGVLDKFQEKIRQMFGFATPQSVSAIDRTELDEFWFLDYSRDPTGEKRQYPNGRHIILADGDVILLDEPNPYIDGQFPLDYMEWHFDLNSIWGFGDIELYKMPQDMLNKAVSVLLEHMTLMTNAIWIGDADALEPEGWAKLTNAPGTHVKVRPGRALRREPPPPMSAGTFELLNFLMGGMERLSGITDITMGRRPGELSSGTAISQMMEAAQTVIRYKARCLESLLTRVGQKLISRIFQYVNDARVFKVIGDADKVLNYHFEKKKYITDPGFTYQDFSFLIVPGSSLNANRFQKGLQVLQLFQMGIIKNPKWVLRSLEIPDVEDIIKDNKQIEADEVARQLTLGQLGLAQSGQLQKGISQDPNDRGTGGGPGGRRDDQLPRPILRSPETGQMPGK